MLDFDTYSTGDWVLLWGAVVLLILFLTYLVARYLKPESRGGYGDTSGYAFFDFGDWGSGGGDCGGGDGGSCD